ncbi:peroxin-5, partial [Phenoliferia sp. Uapishka_3]
MQALVGGADCGPSNPLAQLSKQYGTDRGAQQGFRRGGPLPGVNAHHDEASNFFQQQHPNHLATFDLTPLNRALSPQHAGHAPPDWAQSFANSTGQEVWRTDSPNPALMEAQARAFQSSPGPAMMMNGGSGGGTAQWGSDFARQQMQQRSGQIEGIQQGRQGAEAFQSRGLGQAGLMYGGASGFQQGRMQAFSGAPMQMGQSFQQDAVLQPAVKSTDWETAFLAQESSTMSGVAEEVQARPASPILSDSMARDALAQTAGELLNTVESVERQRSSSTVEPSLTNDKFANSTFLDLMRRLRDGEVAVEGDQVVEQAGAHSSLDKGKGKATGWASNFEREEEGRVGASPTSMLGQTDGMGRQPAALAEFAAKQQSFAERQAANAGFAAQQAKDDQFMNTLWDDEDQTRAAREGRNATRKVSFQGDGGVMEDDEMDERSVERMRMDTSVPLSSSNWEEDFDASMISGGHATNIPRTTERQPSAQQKEWDMLQNDWDTFEATTSGLKPVASTSSDLNASGYAFTQNNPYVNSTRTHSLHQQRSTYDSILEHEAVVQRNPRDAQGWIALGIKQQENEREELAIKALNRALELDPDSAEAYLALAVSYTNENERSLAYESIDKWVNTLAISRYPRLVENYRDLFGKLPPASGGQHPRHTYLTGLLIQLAQVRSERDGADVDADVQIGLGVLFNTSEEYDKASDCFESALSVRPDDPLLYNRLGATLANSGKTDEAIKYYHEALEIQPAYVRARFNLAVANMNLGQYESAVEHLMTSLSLQEADHELQDGDGNNQASGVTSQTLWDSLNVALLMMHRSDLANLTSSRDLAGLRAHFSADV